jgi:hypothetical protein
MYQAHTSTETTITPMKTSMKIIRSVGLMLSSRLGSLVADGAEALTAGIYGGHAGAELPPGMAGTWLGATVTLLRQGQKQRDHERANAAFVTSTAKNSCRNRNVDKRE